MRFCVERDTSYKPNSLEIDFITRTFYQNGGVESDHSIELKKSSRDSNTIFMVIRNGSIRTASFANRDEFFKFITDAETVLKNYDKDLLYNFGGGINVGEIKSGYESGTVELTLCDDDHNCVVHAIDNAELDSMRSCYERLMLE